MEVSRFARDLFHTVLGSSIGRCRASGTPCRVSVNLSCLRDPVPYLRVSVSDTGVGCVKNELTDLKNYIRKYSTIAEEWDGELCVTTTRVSDKRIHKYKVCLKDTSFPGSVERLPSNPKNGKIFSGTEISFSFQIVEENIAHLVVWTIEYIRKMLILKVPMVAIELMVEHVDACGSKRECVVQSGDGVLLPLSVSTTERLASGLQEYMRKHGNSLDKECVSCSANSEHLKFGNGVANSTGQVVEVVIALVDKEYTHCSHPWLCSSKSEVLYFEDFLPSSMPQMAFAALKSIKWQTCGFVLNTEIDDGSCIGVLDWRNLLPFTRIEIAVHCYSKQIATTQMQQRVMADVTLIKKAVKLALADLKVKYAGILLSCHASKIQGYVPDLSRSIAGLILSSKDADFQLECASLLGLKPEDIDFDGRVESCISEKIATVVKTSDGDDKKRKRQDNPCLFEAVGEDCLIEDDDIEEEEIIFLEP